MKIHVTSSSLQKLETILLEKYSYKRLEEKVHKIFPKKKVAAIRDLEGNNVRDLPEDVVKKKEEWYAVVLLENESLDAAPVVKFSEDFVPDPKMLVDGGVTEYDFVTALAEIIDNSIEAMLETDETPALSIKYEGDAQKNYIIIRDNGKGMLRDDVIKWGTLGLNSKQRGVSMIGCPYPLYLCGQFSRFGVGSKNAAFFLGDNVTVESKSKNSRSIHSVSFQRALLETRRKSAKEDWWKDDVTTTPAPVDKQDLHYTETTITTLKPQFLSILPDTMDQYRARLEEIYHYYVFGPNGAHPASLEKLHFTRVDIRLSERNSKFIQELANCMKSNPVKENYFFLTPANGMEVLDNLSDEEKETFMQHHIAILPGEKKQKMTKTSFAPLMKAQKTFKTIAGSTITVVVGEAVELGKRFHTTTNKINLFAAFGEPAKYVSPATPKKNDKKIEEELWYIPISEPLYCPAYQPVEMHLMQVNITRSPSPWDRFGMYQLKSQAELRFEVPIEADVPVNYTQADVRENDKVRCTFRFHIMYFPLQESEGSDVRLETNPDYYDDQGALLNPPTTYWFWNGRLIPRAALDFWAIFKQKKDQKNIPKECFSVRTRIFAFIDSSIGVAKNKVYLDLESPLLKELIASNNKRRNVEDVQKFMEYCHMRYDLEAEWSGPGVLNENKIYYSKVMMQGKAIEKGTKVKVMNPKKFGWVEALFEDAESNRRPKMARIIPWAENRDENSKLARTEYLEVLLSKISILTQEQWEVEVEKGREQFGKELVFSDIVKGSQAEHPVCLVCLCHVKKRELKCKSCKAHFHRSCYTKPQKETEAYKESLDDIENAKLWCCDDCIEKEDIQEYFKTARCGHTFKEMAVTLLDDKSKPKASQNEVVWQILDPAGHEHRSYQDVKQYKNTQEYRGKYYIRTIMFPTPGIWTMKAYLKNCPSIQGIASIKVVSGYPVKFHESKITNSACRIGEEIHNISLVCVDKADHPVRFLPNHPPTNYTLKVLNSPHISVEPGHSLTVNEEGELILSGVILEGSIEDSQSVILSCSLAEENEAMTCLIRLTLQAGPPSTMETDFKQGLVIDNYSFLPKFTVHVYDEYGNHINNEEEYHVQIGLPNPVEFLVQDGIAEIDLEQKDVRIECSFKDMDASEEMKIEVKLLKTKKPRGLLEVEEVEPIECLFSVRPSKKPHALKLFTQDGEQLVAKGAVIAGSGLKLVGQAEELVQLFGQFVNESQMIIALDEVPAATFNFSKHFAFTHMTFDQLQKQCKTPSEWKQKNMFLLPTLALPSSTFDKTKGEIQVMCGKKLTVQLEFKVLAAPPSQFEVKLPPHLQCSKQFTVALILKDKFANIVAPNDLSGEFKDELKSSLSFVFGEGFQYELTPTIDFNPDHVVLANMQIDVVGRHQGLIKLNLGELQMQQAVMLDVGHGAPASLQINDDRPLSGRPDGVCQIKATLVDDQGNVCDKFQDIDLEISSVCFVTKKFKTKLIKGVAHIDVPIKKIKYGNYQVIFEAQIGSSEKISTQVDLELEKSNAVQKLELVRPIEVIPAGSTWRFHIGVVTEDEQALQRDTYSFKVVISNPALVGSDIENILNITREEDNKFVIDMDKLERAGQYTMHVIWDEQRLELQTNIPPKMTIPIVVKPLAATALRLSCHCATPSLHQDNIFFRPVSNKSDFRERSLCKNLELAPVDIYGNLSEEVLDNIVALLQPISELSSDAVKPEVMYQTIVPKRGSYFVHNLSIKADSGSGTAEYQIHFEARTAAGKVIRSIFRQFKFSDDAGKTKNERALSEILQKVQRISNERAEIERRISASREELTLLEGSISGTLNIFGVSLNEYTPDWVDQTRQRLHLEKRDLARELRIAEPSFPSNEDSYVNKVRALVIEHQPKNPHEKPLIFGLGLDIICLPKDERIARGVLAAISPGDLKLIILRSKEAEPIIEKSFNWYRSITVDQAETYHYGNPNPNDNRIPDNQILPKCCRNGTVNPKNYGFIGFLVNLIELRPQHIHLRTSVFWSVFKTKMIFESYAQAREFRSQVLQNRDSCPYIQCLDGIHIEASGVKSTSNQNRAWRLGDLPIEFSSHPLALALGRKFKALKELPAQMERFTVIKDNYHASEATLQEFDATNGPKINELQKQKEEIESRMNQTSRKRTRDSTGNNERDDEHDRPRKKVR